MSERRAFVRDLPLADLDILGGEPRSDFVVGDAILAQLAGALADDRGEDGEPGMDELREVATAVELDQIRESAHPSWGLDGVALKLALAVRLGASVIQEGSPYGDAVSRLLAVALSDVILLRQAEVTRRERLAPAAGAEP